MDTATNVLNVISHVSGNLGISVTARSIIRMLLDRGVQVAVLDIDPGRNRHGFDKSFAELTVESHEQLPHGINLFILPPSSLAAHLKTKPIQRLVSREDAFNVAFSMWELTVLPRVWRSALEFFDVVVAESDFVRRVFEFNLARGIILGAEHPLYVPKGIEASRERFGLPAAGTLFVTACEPSSDFERKNPAAAVEAFAALGANATDAHLVVKVNNARVESGLHSAVRALQTRCASLPRVHLITDTLSYRDTLGLYATCDAVVALHRSEGLGLVAMEAMMLAKPVIATAWSGNLSFMNHFNSCLVPYRLVPARGTISAYRRDVAGLGATWADPDLTAATAWMRELTQSKELRSVIGRRAEADMRSYQDRARAALWLDEIGAIRTQRRRLRAQWSPQAALARLVADNQRAARRARWTGRALRTLYDRHIGSRLERLPG